MSNLIIVDLDHADELSSSSMDQVVGGMSCSDAVTMSKMYTAFGDIMMGLDDTQRASNYYGQAKGVVEGGCA